MIQFVGHWYEGRKPAFVDDIIGLLVGPMFVVAEALFSSAGTSRCWPKSSARRADGAAGLGANRLGARLAGSGCASKRSKPQ